MAQAARKIKEREEIVRKLGSALLDALEFMSAKGSKSALIPIEEFLAETSPREKHVAIGKRVCERRRSLELSQAETAKFIDVSQSVYSRIETGDKVISIVKAEKLSKILKCSPEWIIAGTKPQ